MTTKMDGITQNQNQKTIDAVIATRSHEAMLPKALECTGDPYGGGTLAGFRKEPHSQTSDSETRGLGAPFGGASKMG